MANLSSRGSQLDLATVALPDRAIRWQTWAATTFPGLRVVRLNGDTPLGIARHIPFGAASIWTMVVSGQTLRHSGLSPTSGAASAAVLFHHEGHSQVAQAGRTCTLRRGDLCVIDGSVPFEMMHTGVGSVTLLQLPHPVAVARIPRWLQASAQCANGESAEVGLLHAFIAAALRVADRLSGSAAASALDALLGMLANVPLPRHGEAIALPYAVRAALADIELLVGESTLCAGSLARRRGVSRRRLDALFMEHLGSTVAAQILERRLAQCAANLCDWRKRHRSVASIAIDAGFKTGAHFSRRFKHRFGSTAREWRLRHLPTGSR